MSGDDVATAIQQAGLSDAYDRGFHDGITAERGVTQEQIIEVGKALLPYLKEDLPPEQLGMAAHDAVAALNRVRMRSAA